MDEHSFAITILFLDELFQERLKGITSFYA